MSALNLFINISSIPRFVRIMEVLDHSNFLYLAYFSVFSVFK